MRCTGARCASASSTIVMTVIPAADLALSQNANPSTVQVSNNVTFTIVLTNRGPSDAADVVITDPLPASFSFVSAQSTQGVVSQGSGTVNCSIASFANGASATLTIVATAPGVDGIFQNTASVTATTADLNPNNSASASVTVTQNTNVPSLLITLVDTNVVLSWSTDASGFHLQVAPEISSSPAWVDLPDVPVIVGQQYVVTNAIGSGGFYRLKKP